MQARWKGHQRQRRGHNFKNMFHLHTIFNKCRAYADIIGTNVILKIYKTSKKTAFKYQTQLSHDDWNVVDAKNILKVSGPKKSFWFFWRSEYNKEILPSSLVLWDDGSLFCKIFSPSPIPISVFLISYQIDYSTGWGADCGQVPGLNISQRWHRQCEW